jgi:hypothetical protein
MNQVSDVAQGPLIFPHRLILEPVTFHEVNYILSSAFIVVTTLVLELCALGSFTVGHMHVTMFRVFFFLYRLIKEPETFHVVFLKKKLHIKFAFCRFCHLCSGVMCPWIFYCRTYACNSFPGLFSILSHVGTWNFSFMRFLWDKLHIKLSFHCRDHFGSGVMCPWIFHYRTYMHVTVLRDFFLHHFTLWLLGKVLWCCQ